MSYPLPSIPPLFGRSPREGGGAGAEGSIRQMVLEGCAQAGIGVVLSPPNVADVARWEGAFVTSTSRLVLPIDVLGLPEGIGSEGARAPRGTWDSGLGGGATVGLDSPAAFLML